MSTKDFQQFVDMFRRAFMNPAEEWGFMMLWQRKLTPFDFDALEYAIVETTADPRIAGNYSSGWCRTALPILLDHAREFLEIRQRQRDADELKRLKEAFRAQERADRAAGIVRPTIAQLISERAKKTTAWRGEEN